MSAYFGASWINVRGNFTADTTGLETPAGPPPAFPPHVFVNYTLPSHTWAFGLGVYVPYGLTSQWPNGFQGNFAGRRAAGRRPSGMCGCARSTRGRSRARRLWPTERG